MQILDPIENVIYARGDLINIYVDVFIFNMKCKGPILNNKVFKTSDFSELHENIGSEQYNIEHCAEYSVINIFW